MTNYRIYRYDKELHSEIRIDGANYTLTTPFNERIINVTVKETKKGIHIMFHLTAIAIFNQFISNKYIEKF